MVAWGLRGESSEVLWGAMLGWIDIIVLSNRVEKKG